MRSGIGGSGVSPISFGSAPALFSLFAAIAIFVVTAAILSANGAGAATINVDGSGGRDYTTIQAAINAAVAGDTIYVYNGTYNEQVVINKTINLVGASNQSTVIQGNYIDYSNGIYIIADYVNVSNFRIERSYYGIHVANADNSNITGNAVNSGAAPGSAVYAPQCGVYLERSSNNIITQNVAYMCNFGVCIDSGSSGNTVSGGAVSHCYYGFYAAASSNAIMGNTITDSIQHNIFIGANDCIISGNTLSGCEYSIVLFSVNNNAVTGNVISNTGCGVYVYGRSNTVASNTVTKSGRGVHFCYGSDNTVKSNIFADNFCGIFLEYGTGNSIKYNTIANSTNSGIGIEQGASGNNISHNNIYGNSPYGVSGPGGGGNAAYDNWWGSASGPNNAASNPNGTGDKAANGVQFSPWAVQAFDIAHPPLMSLPPQNQTPLNLSANVNECPTVAITSHFTGKANGTISITGNSSDDVLVQCVQIRIDGGNWTNLTGANLTGANLWNYSLDTTRLANGSHTIIVRAFDGVLYSGDPFAGLITINVENAPKSETNNAPSAKSIMPGFEFAAVICAIGAGACAAAFRRKKG